MAYLLKDPIDQAAPDQTLPQTSTSSPYAGSSSADAELGDSAMRSALQSMATTGGSEQPVEEAAPETTAAPHFTSPSAPSTPASNVSQTMTVPAQPAVQPSVAPPQAAPEAVSAATPAGPLQNTLQQMSGGTQAALPSNDPYAAVRAQWTAVLNRPRQGGFGGTSRVIAQSILGQLPPPPQ